MSQAAHYKQALVRLQRIIIRASDSRPQITEHEAFEQIVEELELAGFGSPELDPALAREFDRTLTAH